MTEQIDYEKLNREVVQHWENIRDGIEPYNLIGMPACAYCKVFAASTLASSPSISVDVETDALAALSYLIVGINMCRGCPVRIKTGVSMCCNTPYKAYNIHTNSNNTPPRWRAWKHYKWEKKRKILAQHEIDFLETLYVEKIS